MLVVDVVNLGIREQKERSLGIIYVTCVVCVCVVCRSHSLPKKKKDNERSTSP